MYGYVHGGTQLWGSSMMPNDRKHGSIYKRKKKNGEEGEL